MGEKNRTGALEGLIPLLLIAVIFGFALADVITIYNVGGINWDFIAEVLYAKAIISPGFWNAFFGGNLANAVNYGNSFYFEALRPPLIGVLMAPFAIAAGNNFVPLYLTFGLLLLLFSTLYVSGTLGVDPLLLALIFFTPYVIFFFFLLNGAEIISMSFLLVYLGLVLEKRWESGIMIAIAGLAKYNSLIFILLLFMLPKGTRKKAFLCSVAVTLPWLLFNTIVWQNPVYSYAISTGSFVGDRAGIFNTTVITESLKLILPDLAPAFLVVVGLSLLYLWRGRMGRNAGVGMLTKMSYKYRVVLAALAIGWISWLLGSLAGSINDSPREGYIIYLGMALIFGLLITDLPKHTKLPSNKLYACAITLLFVATLGMLVSAFNSLYTSYVFGAYGSTNPIYGTVTSTLAEEGLSNCSVISNNWVYLIYAGIKAHFPYAYNATEQRYPIVYFTDLGSNNSAVNFENVTRTLNYTDFYIAFPRNWTCTG